MKKKIKKITADGLVVLTIERLIVDLRGGRLLYFLLHSLTVFFTRYGLQPDRSLDRRPRQYWSGFT